MVKFNAGRFVFYFDDETNKMIAIVDNKYNAEYTVEHYAFKQVLKITVGHMELDFAKKLCTKLDEDPILKRIVSKVIYNRERMLYS